LGDELDSPRGRIYQIQDMLERGGAPSSEVVTHIDRCLSCLACMTTCPSGVNYMHLIDHARSYIEAHHRRPLADRLLRSLLSALLTRPRLFGVAKRLGAAFAWLAPVMPGSLGAMLEMTKRKPQLPARNLAGQTFSAAGDRQWRVALLAGCVQPTLGPQINAATVRLLTRHGVDVVEAPANCCGALPHHLGNEDRTRELARRLIDTWHDEIENGGLDAIIVTASGCGTTIKDYGFLLRDDPVWADKAQRVSALCLDVTQFLARVPLRFSRNVSVTVAYQSACSLQHGQQVRAAPRQLLVAAGFRVVEPREAHICCGSAGTYNLLQPRIARQLRQRKTDHLAVLGADLVATGNIGCMTHLTPELSTPIVHTVELLDWATGGPVPSACVKLGAMAE
jgi:glycolate oxidase iron-sulfur subunit